MRIDIYKMYINKYKLYVNVIFGKCIYILVRICCKEKILFVNYKMFFLFILI